jgi:hypothetical protein
MLSNKEMRGYFS